MKKYRKNFKSKFYLACSSDKLRPALDYVQFKNGKLCCTNAHILVTQSLSAHGFEEEEIKHFEGKFLHKDAVKKIMNFDIATATEDGIECRKLGSNTKVTVYWSTFDYNFPQWENVIPKESAEVESVGLSVTNLSKLKNLTMSNIGNMEFKFHGKNKAVLIKGTGLEWSDETILIMPITL